MRSTEDVTEEMERQRKIKQEAFLPLLLFSTKYLELFTSSWPRLSQLAVCSAFWWRPHMPGFSRFSLEHPLNVRPGHRAHGGKDFQRQRQDKRIKARNTRLHLSTTLEKSTCSVEETTSTAWQRLQLVLNPRSSEKM